MGLELISALFIIEIRRKGLLLFAQYLPPCSTEVGEIRKVRISIFGLKQSRDS
jgi:hypothetical protein